jgi:predicted aspartyl protease
MTFPYDRDYSPPAPALPIELAYPGESPRVGPVRAFVDTGADGSFIPTSYLETLDVPILYPTRVRLMFGPPYAVNVYRVDVLVAGVRLPAVEVVGNDEGADIILGRNILNQLRLYLDGPDRSLEILNRRPRQ